jgi:hypothetical protein
VEQLLRTHARNGLWRTVAEILGLEVSGQPGEYILYAKGQMNVGCVWVLHTGEIISVHGRLADGRVTECSPDDAVDVLIRLHKAGNP